MFKLKTDKQKEKREEKVPMPVLKENVSDEKKPEILNPIISFAEKKLNLLEIIAPQKN